MMQGSSAGRDQFITLCPAHQYVDQTIAVHVSQLTIISIKTRAAESMSPRGHAKG